MRYWKLYNKFLIKKPIITNLFTGCILGFSGDFICQAIVENKNEYDSKRLFSLTTFSTFYHGLINPIIYNYYSNLLHKNIKISPIKFGITCSIIDNFIHVPFLYTPSFFISTSLLQGNSLESSIFSMKNGLIPSITACWIMWIPLQFINFTFLPNHIRPTFVNFGCLVWSVIIDHISNKYIE